MGQRLEGKVAIVTGAGGGIGRACALLLASEGASVLVNDLGTRTGANAEAVAREIAAAGGAAIANGMSATWDRADEIVGHALESFGRVDILINNATAGGGPSDIWDVTESGWDHTYSVNIKGYFAMIRALAPHFCTRGSGAIVNMSSGSGFGHATMIPYSSAKEGVVGLTRSVAREIGRFGVRCNAIRPLALATSFTEYGAATAKWAKLIITTGGSTAIPQGMDNISPETHPPAKIAPMATWLCTEAASGVNGRTFHVRGDEVALIAEPSHEHEMHREGGWTLDALDELALRDLVPESANRWLLPDMPELRIYDGPQG